MALVRRTVCSKGKGVISGENICLTGLINLILANWTGPCSVSYLLPIPRNHDVTSRLRAASLYPRPVTRTKRYTSSAQAPMKLGPYGAIQICLLLLLLLLFFITLSVTDVICDFGCCISLFVISMYCTFSFCYCSIFLLKSSGFYNLLLKQ